MNRREAQRRGRPVAWACMLTWLLSGCGAPGNHAVTGTVTLDGRPLPDALVAFAPAGDEGTWASGRTDSQGGYSLRQGADLEGTIPGRYKVRITTLRDGNAAADPPIPLVPEKVPAKYNLETELTAVVLPNQTTFDFHLQSGGDAALRADEAPSAAPTHRVPLTTEMAGHIRRGPRTLWYLVTIFVWLAVLLGCFAWWRLNVWRQPGRT